MFVNANGPHNRFDQNGMRYATVRFAVVHGIELIVGAVVWFVIPQSV
jgi:hypothetical protein